MTGLKSSADGAQNIPSVMNPASSGASMLGSSTAQYPSLPDAKGMVEPGNIKGAGVFDRKILKNKDGSYSTTSSISIGTDKGETLIPTVVNGKRLTVEQAIKHFEKTGEHLGIFDTPDNADAYAEALHNAQAKYVEERGLNR